jgi:hypothetical protein
MATDKARQNSEEVKKNTQETAKETRTIKQTMDELAKTMVSVASTMADVARNSKETAKESRDFRSEFDQVAKLQKSIEKDTEAVFNLTQKINKGQKLNTREMQRLEKAQSNINRLKTLEEDLQAKLVNALDEEKVLINAILKDIKGSASATGEVTKGINKINDAMEKLDNQSSFFSGMAEITEAIPGLGKAFKEFSKAEDAYRKASVEGNSGLVAGATQLIGAAGKLTALFAIGTFVKGVGAGQEKITQIARDLNISRKEASNFKNEMTDLAGNVQGLGYGDLVTASREFSKNLGASVKLTGDEAKAFATLTKQIGLSVEETSILARQAAATGQSIDDISSGIAGFTAKQNVANGVAIRFQDVMSDVAGTSAGTALNSGKFAGGIEKAAYQARRFGLSMQTLESAGSNLLEFESSIAAELEAELLTGKQLNLERARAAALTGNQAVLAEEIAKNVGTIEDFQSQTVLGQEAQAKALGMSRDELAEMLRQQAALKRFGEDESANLQDIVKAYDEKIALAKAEGDLTKARSLEEELITKLGDTQMGAQRKNQSVQDRMLEATEQMAAEMGKVAIHLDSIGGFFDGITQNAGAVMGFITKLGSKMMAIGNTTKEIGFAFKGITRFISVGVNRVGAFFKAMGAGAKFAAKGGFKSLAKKIPFLGALIGLGLAAQRYRQGDYLGAGLEFISGITSFVPGLGTLAGVGIDAGLMGLDAAGVTGRGREGNKIVNPAQVVPGMTEEDDFISRPGGGITSFNKGDLVIGGTNLMGGGSGMMQALERQNQLLESILNKDTDVKMNTYSVQSALVVDNFKNG